MPLGKKGAEALFLLPIAPPCKPCLWAGGHWGAPATVSGLRLPCPVYANPYARNHPLYYPGKTQIHPPYDSRGKRWRWDRHDIAAVASDKFFIKGSSLRLIRGCTLFQPEFGHFLYGLPLSGLETALNDALKKPQSGKLAVLWVCVAVPRARVTQQNRKTDAFQPDIPLSSEGDFISCSLSLPPRIWIGWIYF